MEFLKNEPVIELRTNNALDCGERVPNGKVPRHVWCATVLGGHFVGMKMGVGTWVPYICWKEPGYIRDQTSIKEVA